MCIPSTFIPCLVIITTYLNTAYVLRNKWPIQYPLHSQYYACANHYANLRNVT